MAAAANWVPLRWPAAWRDAASLDLLKGTPFNCLLLDDAAAQAGVSAAAKAAGIAVADVPRVEHTAVPWQSPAPILAVTDARWPGIAVAARESEDSNAGPTQSPWIDSNGWFLQLAAARAPATRLWPLFAPPADRILRPDDYVRAIADTEMAGGRWPVSLAPQLAADLAKRTQESLATWRAICAAATFFAKRTRPGPQAGALAVVSDFAGANQFPAFETLNLVARRNLPFRVIDKSQAVSASFSGLRGVCCLDEPPVDKPLRDKLDAFARAGGLAVVSKGFAGGEPVPSFDHPRFELRRLGKGRIAVAKEDGLDPYLVARDLHQLVDRSNDLLRFYNISSLLSHYSEPAPGRALVQLLNFARRAPDDVITVWVRGRWRSAAFWTPSSPQSQSVAATSENDGTALHLPSVPVYAAVELSAQG